MIDTTSDAAKPLPCPFCGTEPQLHGTHNGNYFLECKTGGCVGHRGLWTEPTKAEAITRWNKRAAPSPPPPGWKYASPSDVLRPNDRHGMVPARSPGDEGDARIAEMRERASHEIYIGDYLKQITQVRQDCHDLLAALDAAKQELGNEIAFNEGWQEHISDLLGVMSPFVVLVKQTDGRIPTERLSFANWHSLSKVFDAAVDALNAGRECKSQRLDAAMAKVEGMRKACREALSVVDECYAATGHIKVAKTSEQRMRIDAALAQAGEGKP